MKIIIPGGTGQVGNLLARTFSTAGHDVVVLSRHAKNTTKWRTVDWDAKTLGPWTNEIDGADVVINLAGRKVNCRYTDANKQAILNSRVDSTKAVGEAIRISNRPPKVWLQMSTATIYTHRFDAPNDEATGIIELVQKDAPASWNFSIQVATSWERAAIEIKTPQTRKALMRTAVMMSPDADGPFDILLGLVRRGLGGTNADGRQYVSWIHDTDLARAVSWLIEHDIEGPVNLAAPNPLPNKEFMAALRAATGTRIGLPSTKWMLALGALFLRSETELILKSRRVVPTRLIDSGFKFEFPDWPQAARDLLQRA